MKKKELTKYMIVIGDNPELSREVQEALFEAGFRWRMRDKPQTGCLAVILNTVREGEITGVFPGNRSICHTDLSEHNVIVPSDVLNGKAFDLDGAKKPEPRYFIGTTCDIEGDVYEAHVRGWKHVYTKNGRLVDFTGCWQATSFGIGDFLARSAYAEITAEDVEYVKNHAERAKAEGFELRKPGAGEEWISALDGLCGKYRVAAVLQGRVAGYRYCRKVEKETGPFCHKCGKEICPKESNFCSQCGTKLK